MICSNCGKQNPPTASFCQNCGNALASKPSVVSSGGPYAGFWIRFVAIVIDVVILTVASAVAAVGTFGAAAAVSFVGPWLYEALMLSSEWQATVGKRVMSIVVTGVDGSRISFGRATGRHFAKYISAFLLCIGFIMAAFTEKKQALHDMIAETLVVKREQ